MPNIPRPQLIKILAVVFVTFVVVGWIASAVASRLNPVNPNTNAEIPSQDDSGEVSFDGTVAFVDPRLNPGDEISFSLIDPLGNELILLKSQDRKLEVSEGHRATVFGVKRKALSGKDYLLVSKVIIKNGAN